MSGSGFPPPSSPTDEQTRILLAAMLGLVGLLVVVAVVVACVVWDVPGWIGDRV